MCVDHANNIIWTRRVICKKLSFPESNNILIIFRLNSISSFFREVLNLSVISFVARTFRNVVVLKQCNLTIYLSININFSNTLGTKKKFPPKIYTPQNQILWTHDREIFANILLKKNILISQNLILLVLVLKFFLPRILSINFAQLLHTFI